jgi:hypothetical protein
MLVDGLEILDEVSDLHADHSLGPGADDVRCRRRRW